MTTGLDLKKRFSEDPIIGFLRETEAGMPINNLYRRKWLRRGLVLSVAQQVRWHERARRQATEGLEGGEHSLEEAIGTAGHRDRSHQGCFARKW